MYKACNARQPRAQLCHNSNESDDMDEDSISSLRHFIAGAIAQQTADIESRLSIRLLNLENRLDKKLLSLEDSLSTRICSLEAKVDDGFVAIAGILEDIHTRCDAQEAMLKGAC